MRNTVLLIALAAAAYWQWTSQQAVPVETDIATAFPLVQARAEPDLATAFPVMQGNLALSEMPLQLSINPSRQAFPAGDRYRIVPLAEFHAEARVLSAREYRSGREADLSPVDLALGWGPMTREEVLAALTITQSGRWYHWRTENFPIPRREIERNSANMHFIPANAEAEAALRAVRAGHLVRFSGYLVEVQGSDGWTWKSSLTRDDTGQGGCEVVLLESLAYR